MDTFYAKNFRATDLSGEVLKRLGSNRHACARLLESLGPIDGVSAVEMIKLGTLTGDVGDCVHDFFSDEIENEAEDVWSGTLYDPVDEENVDTHFPIGISEYCGVCFVRNFDHENAGYFLSRIDALEYVMNYVDETNKGLIIECIACGEVVEMEGLEEGDPVVCSACNDLSD